MSQPYPGFLREQRKLRKAKDHNRRETVRAARKARRSIKEPSHE